LPRRQACPWHRTLDAAKADRSRLSKVASAEEICNY
jgi:hypothetical protein